ncbi:MAG TPA: NAD(P)-dependent oxidoreductase [Polyangia bacterium]|jgi:3-hydroxyisobutyrate dehydrogenase
MSKVAFIGLGRMGAGMATRLLSSGHALTVYNRTASRAAPLVAAGARAAATAFAACGGAEAAFSMTADDESSRAVWLGESGGLAALSPGALVVECSTVSHDWALELGAAARARGLRYLDAPVTGLPEAAAAGTLTLLVGAREEDLEAARLLLTSLANRILHFGRVGAGTAYKLTINLMGAVQIGSAAEGMALAERAGLAPTTVGAAFETSQAASPQVVRNVRRFVTNDHDREVVFSAALRLKDVEYALRLARKLGYDAAYGEVAERTLRRLVAAGHAGENESRIVDVMRGVLK